MAAEDDLKPWDRQPGETSKAYADFQVFLDQGPERTLQKTANEVSKSAQHIRRLSTQHGWQARAAAWDSMPRRAVVGAYEEMAQRIANQHEELATKLMEKLRANVDLLKPGADPSVRFSTALGAARQSHQFATDLSKPADAGKEAIVKAIESLAQKLTADE